ncbi:MAG: hypothetical protein ACOYOJ_03605 [Alsobacter sp.]
MTGDTDNTRPRGGEGGSRGRGTPRREPPVIDLKAEAASTSTSPAVDTPASPVTTETGPAAVAPDMAATTNAAVDASAMQAPLETAALQAEASLSADPVPAEPVTASSEAVVTQAVLAEGDRTVEAISATTEPEHVTHARDTTKAATTAGMAATAAAAAATAGLATAGLATAGAATATSPSPTRPGLLRPALAGVIGGAVGAALVGAAVMYLTPVGDYGDRLATLETGLGDKATRRGLETAERRIGTTETSQQALRTDLDGVSKRLAMTSDDGAGAIQRLEQLTRTVTALAARPVPTPEPGRPPEPPPPPPPPVPALGARESAVMAVAWLTRDALARGVPFARELDALEASRVDSVTIAALKPFAAAGAPSPARLATALTPLVERMAKPAPVPAEAGVVDRLTAGISRLYRVRPLGGEGEDPASLASRAEAALQRGSLPDALAALEKIPAPAPDLKAVADTVRARIAAGKAADALVVTAVDAVIAATRSGGPAR